MSGMKIVPERMYHVDGWNKGAFFRLIKVKDDIALLETPKKRKKFKVEVSKLRNINKYGSKKLNPLAPKPQSKSNKGEL